MQFDYPEEIKEQQAIVKRELKKLARMRTEHLIATGQMPRYKPNTSHPRKAADASPAVQQSHIKSS